MLNLKEKKGFRSEWYEQSVQSSDVNDFAGAVQFADPSGDVPWTFLTRCRAGEFELLKTLEIPLAEVLHAEQEYQFESKITVGMTLKFQAVVAEVLEKRGSTSSLTFVTMETEFFSATQPSAGVIARSRTGFVLRKKVETP